MPRELQHLTREPPAVEAVQRAGARRATGLLAALLAGLACALAAPAGALALPFSFVSPFHTVSSIGSAVPSNGDVNPYGIVTVPRSVGSLVGGDLLISNFNNSENLQGTGTTLVQLTPAGALSLFARIEPAALAGRCPGGVGLTSALTVLPDGYVVVGSLPTSNGQAPTAQAGCLIVLSPEGNVVRAISGAPINGPWDLTAVTLGPITELFVTNVLNGTVAGGETPTDRGTVVRIGLLSAGDGPPALFSEQVIATGFPERTDPAALVVGPTGVGVSPGGTLYVADTQDDRIAAVPGALFRQTPLGGGAITVSAGGHLNGPLGLAIAPNGDILTANAGDGNIVETTPFGAQLDAVNTGAGGGGLFGLTVAADRRGVYFVDDTENTLGLLH